MAFESKKSDAPQPAVDVDGAQLGRVYASAALDAAGERAAQASVAEELQSLLADVLDLDPRLEQVFASELIGEEEKLAMLDRLFAGRASAGTLNLLKVMARHGRLGYVRQVARAAQQLWRERSNYIRVEVETALPLDAATEAAVAGTVTKMLGKTPEIVARVNPDLLAGIVVRVGDKVYDASARTGLARSKQQMIDRAVEAIQTAPGRFVGA